MMNAVHDLSVLVARDEGTHHIDALAVDGKRHHEEWINFFLNPIIVTRSDYQE